MDIFLKSLDEVQWETSSAERIKSGANPRTLWKQLIDKDICGSSGLSVGYSKIPKGEDLPLHNHKPQEIYFVIKGSGFLLMENHESKCIKQGDIVYIPENKYHGVRNSGDCDLEFLFIFTAERWKDINYNFISNET